MGVVAFVRVACLVVFFRFFPCSYGKRCGGERSFLENKKAGGGLGGGRSASPPDALGAVAFVRVAFLVLFFLFFLILMSYVFWFFVCSWKRGVAVRGVILKNKKAGGGLGGRAQRLPPQMHWVLLHLFVLHFLFCSSVFFLVLMFFVSSCCSWKRCGGERSHP